MQALQLSIGFGRAKRTCDKAPSASPFEVQIASRVTIDTIKQSIYEQLHMMPASSEYNLTTLM